MPASSTSQRNAPQDRNLPPNERFLRLSDLVSITGMSRTWITDRVRRGEFPPPFKIGYSTFWQESVIRSWMAEQIANSHRASA